VSGRRWGIGLVTVVIAVAMALASLMATIVILFTICDTGQHGPGSTAHRLCDTGPGSAVVIAYLAFPTVATVVAGVVGIKTQRWRHLWAGVGLALLVLVVAGLVLGNVSTTAS
jgi:hypothetical protein